MREKKSKNSKNSNVSREAANQSKVRPHDDDDKKKHPHFKTRSLPARVIKILTFCEVASRLVNRVNTETTDQHFMKERQPLTSYIFNSLGQVNLHPHPHPHSHTQTHTHSNIYTHAQSNKQLHTRVHTFTHASMHLHLHKHIHRDIRHFRPHPPLPSPCCLESSEWVPVRILTRCCLSKQTETPSGYTQNSAG